MRLVKEAAALDLNAPWTVRLLGLKQQAAEDRSILWALLADTDILNR